MSLTFDGVDAESVKFNGSDVESVTVDGVEVWSGYAKGLKTVSSDALGSTAIGDYAPRYNNKKFLILDINSYASDSSIVFIVDKTNKTVSTKTKSQFGSTTPTSYSNECCVAGKEHYIYVHKANNVITLYAKKFDENSLTESLYDTVIIEDSNVGDSPSVARYKATETFIISVRHTATNETLFYKYDALTKTLTPLTLNYTGPAAPYITLEFNVIASDYNIFRNIYNGYTLGTLMDPVGNPEFRFGSININENIININIETTRLTLAGTPIPAQNYKTKPIINFLTGKHLSDGYSLNNGLNKIIGSLVGNTYTLSETPAGEIPTFTPPTFATPNGIAAIIGSDTAVSPRLTYITYY